MSTPTNERPSRRNFLKSTAAATAAFAAAPHVAKAATGDTIRFGVVGTGGRSALDMRNLLLHVDGVQLYMTADVLPDRTEEYLAKLTDEKFMKKDAAAIAKVDVPAERQLIGFDSYKEMLASDEEYTEVFDDIKAECENVGGPVENVVMPREGPNACLCFVIFVDGAGAAKARQSLDQRQFDGNTVKATFLPDGSL